MMHFSDDEADLVAIATAWNNPQAFTLAKKSTEAWIAIEFSIPEHGDTLLYLSRERFCKVIDQVEGKQDEAMPHMDRWVQEKLGLPSVSAWRMTFTFTSQMPDGVRTQ